jgi:hypothetical protein
MAALATTSGGHCALAASLGQDAPGDPEHWRVVDGRLYLSKNGVAAWLFSPPAVDPGPSVLD